MPSFIATIMLQDVSDENIYSELDHALTEEDGYPYTTDDDDKIYALPPDTYEFEVDMSATQLQNAVLLICSKIEKKYQLKKTPIVIVEANEVQFSNLEELNDNDFQTLN